MGALRPPSREVYLNPSVGCFLSSHLQSPEILPSRKELFQPGIIAENSIEYLPTGLDDLRGQVHHRVQEGAKLHSDHPLARRFLRHEQAEPGFEVPGQS